MSEFQPFTLGEVTVNYDSQRVPVRAADRMPGPYPYYGASGIVDSVSDYLFDGTYLLIAEDGENLRTRKTPIAFMAAGKFWVNNHAHVVQGNDLASTEYLAYALSQTDVSGYLSGSTQPKLTQDAMNRIRLLLPDRFHQDAIAEVLGALDNKIAVNHRTAETAEGLIVALGSDERWAKVSPLTELVDHVKDQIQPETVSSDIVAHYSIPAFDSMRLPEQVSPASIKSGKFTFDTAAVLVSKLNPSTPRIWSVEPSPDMPALASTEFLVLRPHPGISTDELWAVCSQPSFISALVGKVTGTSNSHQRVKPADLLATEVIDPRTMSEDIRFRISAIARCVRQARIASFTLAALRDTLLPKLMSGEIRLREAERIAEDAT
jgi:type I restriction enzyme, S subunit